ncbi:phage tail length tape measure family protein [Cupriavidus sp. SS-3]|uniref:phage tail length tape measure family protein n=1 Tax=Cupriavidus sp. SS-3 TaxID=3109596 RepID=UPI002DB9ABAB|nr:phage tail length tape measure family protein [Cupriavidus sp. SS-3]MEC3765013.1 phage tail length tape measure family protein [Cupriavidus sp. SS-3]
MAGLGDLVFRFRADVREFLSAIDEGGSRLQAFGAGGKRAMDVVSSSAEAATAAVKGATAAATTAAVAVESAGRREAAAAAAAGDAIARQAEAARVGATAHQQAAGAAMAYIARLQEQVQTLGMSTRQMMEFRAAQLGVSHEANPLIAKLFESKKGFGDLGVSAAQTAAAMRMVPAQMTDIIVSLQAGQAPLTVLMQQGGQLKDAFGGVVPAAKALGAYVAGLVNPATLAAGAGALLATAMYQGSQEAGTFSKALILSGNAAGTTADQMATMAAKVSSTIGTHSQAADTLTQMAQTGRIAGEVMVDLGEAAIAMSKATGKGIDDTIKEYVKLADEPVKASAALNEQYHYLTLSVYNQIKALAEQGRQDEAAALAQRTYANAMKERANQVLENLGYMQRGWNALKGAALGAWDAMLGLGRAATLGDVKSKIAATMREIDEFGNGFGSTDGGAAVGRGGQGRIAALKKLQDDLAALRQQEAELAGKAAKAQQDAAKQADEDAKIQAQNAIDGMRKQMRSRQEVRADEIADMERHAKRLGLSAAEIVKLRASIEAKYADPKGSATGAGALRRTLTEEIALYEGYQKQLDVILKGGERALKSRREQGLLDELGYLDELRQLRDNDLVDRMAVVELEAEAALGKKQTAAYNKYMAELAGLQTKRVENERAYVDQVAELQVKLEQAYRDGIDKQVKSLQEQTDALNLENENYGKTKGELAAITAARYEESLALLQQGRARAQMLGGTAEEIAYYDQAIAGVTKLAQAQRDYAIALTNKEDKDAARKSAEEAAKSWQTAGDDIERALTDSLMRGFENGKGFGENLIDSLKNLFKTTVLQTTIKAFVQPIVGNMMGGIMNMAGTLLGSGSGGLGAVGNALGFASNATNLWSAFTSGQAGVGIGAGLSSIGSFLGSQTLTGFGQGLALNPYTASALADTANAVGMGNFASGLQAGSYVAPAVNFIGGVGAGYGLGSLISGNYAAIGNSQAWASGGGAAAGAAIGSIVPGLGTLLGGVIGGAIGGVVNRMFGRGPKELQSAGIEGRFTGAGFSGGQYADYKQKGGWFRSDRYSSESKPFSDKEFSAIQTEFFGMVDIFKGLNAVSNRWEMDSRLGMFDYSIRNDWRSEENRKKSWGDLGDALAENMIPGIAAFREEGENLVQTALRLTDIFKSTNVVAEALGKNLDAAFGIGGIGGAAKREAMVDAAGGTQQLGAITSAYMEAAFSEQEKITFAAKQLGDQFAALGFSMPQSTAQLREWIEQQDLSRENEAQHAVALMALTPAYKQLEDAMRSLNGTVVEARTGIADVEHILLTDQQKQENRIRSMREELDKLGLSSITTREGLLEYARGLDRNSEAGERAYQALVRVAPAFLEVEAAAAQAAAAAEAAAARTRELTDGYFSRFKSPAEQLGRLQEQLAAEFAKLGHALPMSAGAYTQLVDSIDTSTESGRKLKDGLMALAQQMSTFLQQVQAQGKQLGTGLADVMAQQMAAVEALRGKVSALAAEAQAALQLRGNARSLLSQISGALGQAGGTAGRKDQLWGMLNSGISPQQQLDIASELFGLITQVAAVDTSAAQELMSGAQAAASAANSQLSAAKALEDAGRRLHDWVQSLKTGNLSPLTMGEKVAEAARQYQQTLAAAQAGDQTALGNLQAVASSYLELARTYYASSDQYTAIFNQVTGAVDALGTGLMSQGSSQAAAAQAQLDAANKQIEVAQGQLNAAQQQTGLSQAQLDELARLQTFVQGVESAADANYLDLTGKLASELGVLQAMEKALGLQATVPGLLAGLPAELAAALQPLINAASGSTKYANELYQQYLGRPGDKAGVDYWAQQLAEGTRTVDDFMWGAYEEQIKKAYKDVLGREADASGLRFYVQQMQGGKPIGEIVKELEWAKANGSHADGLASVPFDGYRAILHAGERVLTAEDNRIFSGIDWRQFGRGDGALQALVGELRSVKEEVAKLRAQQKKEHDDSVRSNRESAAAIAEASREATKEAAQVAATRQFKPV